MATATYHHITGLSACEYDELVETLADMRNRFIWSGPKYSKRCFIAALYLREPLPKCMRLVEIFAYHMFKEHAIAGYGLKLQNFHFAFTHKYSKMLRDSEGTGNKATLMKLIDDFICETALAAYPDSPEIAEAVNRNRKRWASKKMPSMQRKRPGPKTLHKPKGVKRRKGTK